MVLGAEFKKIADPGIHCSGRTAHFEPFIDRFDGLDRMPIKFEVVLLCACPKRF